MNSVTRLELKKLHNKKNYLIGIIFFLMITILMLTKSSLDVVNNDGEFIRGIKSHKILKEQGISSDGYVTFDYMKEEREKYQNSINKLYIEGIRREDRDLGLRLEHPLGLLFSSLNFPYGHFNTLHHDMNLSDEQIESYYENRPNAIAKYFEQPHFKYTEEEVEVIVKRAEKVKTPFYYEYSRGWSELDVKYSATFYIFLIFIAFILCDLLAKDNENGIEQIALSTRDSRKSLYIRKLHAAEIFSSIAYLCYVGLLLIYSSIVFSLHGANTSIQFFDMVSVFSLTTWQAVFIEFVVGYFSAIVITHLVLFFSALLKRGKAALFICVIYLYLVNDYKWSISESVQNIMYFMPQQFIQGAIHTENLTVIGSFVIPYALVGIFLSIIYILILRFASKMVMKHYYIF